MKDGDIGCGADVVVAVKNADDGVCPGLWGGPSKDGILPAITWVQVQNARQDIWSATGYVDVSQVVCDYGLVTGRVPGINAIATYRRYHVGIVAHEA